MIVQAKSKFEIGNKNKPPLTLLRGLPPPKPLSPSSLCSLYIQNVVSTRAVTVIQAVASKSTHLSLPQFHLLFTFTSIFYGNTVTLTSGLSFSPLLLLQFLLFSSLTQLCYLFILLLPSMIHVNASSAKWINLGTFTCPNSHPISTPR